MRVEFPEFALVALIGASSSGKSTFAREHFKSTEVLSSDAFRAMVCDDENDQSVSEEAFDLLYTAAAKRLSLMKTTVVDATSLQAAARKRIIDLAREQNVHSVALVFDMPERVLQERNAVREDRRLSAGVIHRHAADTRRCLTLLKREGFRFVYVFKSPQEAQEAEIVRVKLWNDKRDEHGPFDLIGDVHGCARELVSLLNRLGYEEKDGVYAHPDGRRAAFLGDLCDRGDENVRVLRLVMGMVRAGSALCVPGNHDVKLLKYLDGKNVQVTHGLEKTIAELDKESAEFRGEVRTFLDGLISHYVLDDGRLVIAHAGIRPEFIGRGSMRVRDFCLYGETNGETDEFGLPVRVDWAADYRGRATIVYGHMPQAEATEVNRTWDIDTGCVFGGKLTCLRYPEMTLVQEEAAREYYPPVRPLAPKLPARADGMLSMTDVSGRLMLETRLIPRLTVREENSAAALEIMSRYAADPRWLIYLPPTMSPCRTSPLEGWLEHPLEAFAYYRENGSRQVVCEKKHMGSRAVIVLCRDQEAARRRFGAEDGSRGIIYTRTGRRFFDDEATEAEVLERLKRQMDKTGFWEEFATDWVCLDAELMPWSEKARTLLMRQYAPVGRAGRESTSAAVALLEKTCSRAVYTPGPSRPDASGQDVDPAQVLARYQEKQRSLDAYVAAYRQYSWTVNRTDDLRIAPFHLLACEGRVFTEETHLWHMQTLKRYCTGDDPIFLPTDYLEVDTEDEASVRAGVAWWEALTEAGGEGMVVKPAVYTSRWQGRLIQPAVKCRGREYLRIIYGPEYLLPEHMARLKRRSLTHKQALALAEFALGVESLERFVRREPMYRVHQCVFGVLAYESEPVDPRL